MLKYLRVLITSWSTVVTTQLRVSTSASSTTNNQCRRSLATSTVYSLSTQAKRRGTNDNWFTQNPFHNQPCDWTCLLLLLFRHSRIFWLENTAPPLREDHWVKLKKDWRTYHRLLLFHSIAMQEANKLNATMTVIPAFRSTLAFFDKICDCAHYPISGTLFIYIYIYIYI